MPERDFPSNVPMCKNSDEMSGQYEEARDDRRPFIAMTEEAGVPRRRVVYDMSSTGRENQRYVLSHDAVKQIRRYRDELERDNGDESDIGECDETEGTISGLTAGDAQDVAIQVAEVVWNTDNWETRRD